MHVFILAILLQNNPYPVYEYTIGFSSMDACQRGIVKIAGKMKPENRKYFIDSADCLEQWVSKEKLQSLRESEKNAILAPTGKPEKQM